MQQPVRGLRGLERLDCQHGRPEQHAQGGNVEVEEMEEKTLHPVRIDEEMTGLRTKPGLPRHEHPANPLATESLETNIRSANNHASHQAYRHGFKGVHL